MNGQHAAPRRPWHAALTGWLAGRRDTWTRWRQLRQQARRPVPYWPAYLTPAPGAAQGQARTATLPNLKAPAVLPPSQPEGAASPSRPAAQAPAHPLPGPGQHPLSAPVPPTAGHGQRWEDIVRAQDRLWPRDGRDPYSPEARRDTTSLVLPAPAGNRDWRQTSDIPVADDPPLVRPYASSSPVDYLFARNLRESAASRTDEATLRDTLAGLRAL